MSQWDWDLSNAWVGTTVERGEALRRVPWLRKIKIPPVRFVSFEPLHSDIVKDYREFQGIDWLIIGAETGNRKGRIVPKEAWIQSILKLADRLKIPVFMKDNLKPYWHGPLRQEFPST
jgi:protein gp37